MVSSSSPSALKWIGYQLHGVPLCWLAVSLHEQERKVEVEHGCLLGFFSSGEDISKQSICFVQGSIFSGCTLNSSKFPRCA